jgi:hypothetical protein
MLMIGLPVFKVNRLAVCDQMQIESAANIASRRPIPFAEP